MELVSNSTFNLLDFVSQPWHWAVSGATIAATMVILTLLGRSFGLSTTFRNFCAMAGAGKRYSFFRVDLKEERWRMIFVVGALIGGFIAAHFLQSPEPVDLSESTIQHLSTWGIESPERVEQEAGFIPIDLFNFQNPKGLILAILGGFLVGFGARYGRGCTSGHAITGLSHLQLPSLITVIGFFIGGLLMTHLIMPLFF